VSKRYYDVVILGAELAPLTCAALLAKRGFRVLVLGQGTPAPNYQLGPFQLPQRSFQEAFGHTPVCERVISELGLGPGLKRPAHSHEPAFQVAVPGHRLDVSVDRAELLRSFEREFPEVRRPIEEFHERVARIMQDLDALCTGELVMPPETFLERQRFGKARRALTALRLPRLPDDEDVLADLPEGHRFRDVAALPARFESGIDSARSGALRMLRLYGNCRRSNNTPVGGTAAFRELLLQKIHAHSGQLRLDERAVQLDVQRGEVAGLTLLNSNDEIACGFVVVGTDIAQLPRWLSDRNALEQLFERVGEPMVRHYRYTLNVVLRTSGMPAGLGQNLYLVRESEPNRPSQDLHIGSHRLDAQHSVISAEALLPARKLEDEPSYLGGVRASCLAALHELLPFLGQHLVLVDSPHDGRAPDYEHTQHAQLNPFQLAQRGPAHMPTVCSYPVLSHLELCALPIRTPIRRLLLCNSQVVPGLGSEGQLMAACSAARVITWADRGRSWMRRRLWTKVET